MKTALTALLLLATLPAMGQDAPAPASTAPSFWHRLGSGIKESASRVGQEIQNPGSTKGDAFRPLTPGANELVGMFTPATSREDGTGKILWPRVALTAEEWGEHKECWTFRAKIWTSEVASHTERFKVCKSSPVKVTNDIGQTGYAEPNMMTFATINSAMAVYTHPTTGDQGTEGPNPPDSLFLRHVPSSLEQASIPFLGRLLMITGFESYISGANHSARMWLAGYEPSGNKG
jgi:hypothetical protein